MKKILYSFALALLMISSQVSAFHISVLNCSSQNVFLEYGSFLPGIFFTLINITTDYGVNKESILPSTNWVTISRPFWGSYGAQILDNAGNVIFTPQVGPANTRFTVNVEADKASFLGLGSKPADEKYKRFTLSLDDEAFFIVSDVRDANGTITGLKAQEVNRNEYLKGGMVCYTTYGKR